MFMSMIVHVAGKMVRLGKDIAETWREAQRLRRALSGPMDE
jgi:hypothetical protein